MRLTNVAQMDLVSGRLRSYTVEVASTGDGMLPISFDQGRHVGEGQRPGSWMAIAFRLSAPVVAEEVAAAWDAVVARHGTLHSAFSIGEGGRIALQQVEVSPGVWREHEVPAGRRSREVLREVFDASCAPFSRPSHRICLIEPAPESGDLRPELVIGCDHAHVDMWSLVILARELAAAMQELRAGRAPGGAWTEVATFAEHTAVLDAMPPAPVQVQRRWAEILESGGGAMPVFPLPLGPSWPLPPEVVEVRDVLDAAATEQLSVAARAAGVRPIAIAMSVLTEVTLELSGEPLRAVFPVHSRHEARWRDAVGWFITNAVIECRDPAPVAAAAAVDEAIGLGSWPLGPLLEPRGGMPATPGMFAVSWLDTRRLPVPAQEVSELRYVSAAIRTDGVMLWFMINASGLHLRCRYPDTPEARTNVGRWLDAVEDGLRERARAA